MRQRLGRELIYSLLGLLGKVLILLLGKSLRIEVRREESALRTGGAEKASIYAFWHGRLLVPAYFFRGRGLSVLISQHQDGEYMSRIVRSLGCNPVRGSTTRGGSAGLRAMVGEGLKGRDLAMTPDGPRGPRYGVKPGTVKLAQLTGMPITPVGVGGSRALVLKSWDRFVLPLPFAKCSLLFGAPILVPPRTELERARAEIERTLRKLTAEAELLSRSSGQTLPVENDGGKGSWDSWGREVGVHRIQGSRVARPFLNILAWLWAGLHGLLFSLRRIGLGKSRTLRVPVISVGNLTVGGTGKTPFTQWLVARLRDRGRRPAVLSRGYGRQKRGEVVVSDGKKMHGVPAEVGDEPYLLAANLTGVPVVVGKDRFNAGKHAIERFGSQVLILDDGFQHLSLRRDLDILLVDSTNPFGNCRTLPAGILREPLGGLSRADVLVLTRADQSEELDELRSTLREMTPGTPIVEAIHKPLGLCPLWDGSTERLDSLKGRRVIALSGLANPVSFERTLAGLGVLLIRSMRYPDHHIYSVEDGERIGRTLEDVGAELVVTTEKDGVKLKGLNMALPIYVLRIGIEVVEGEEVLLESVEAALSNHPTWVSAEPDPPAPPSGGYSPKVDPTLISSEEDSIREGRFDR